MSTSIDIRLDEPTAGSPLMNYPDISDAKKSRLEWYVQGGLRVIIDDQRITNSPYSEEGYLTDHLWTLVMRLNSAISELSAEAPVEVSLSDNPGNFTLTSSGENIKVEFDSETEEHIETEGVADRAEFVEAMASATRELRNELRSVNDSLENSKMLMDLETRLHEIEDKTG